MCSPKKLVIDGDVGSYWTRIASVSVPPAKQTNKGNSCCDHRKPCRKHGYSTEEVGSW